MIRRTARKPPDKGRGQILLIAIFGAMAASEVGLLALNWLAQNAQNILTTSVRLCLTIGLMYAVWIGQRWARWLFVALIYFASVMSLLIALSRPHLLMFIVFAALALIGSLVGFSPDLSAFLSFQARKRDDVRGVK